MIRTVELIGEESQLEKLPGMPFPEQRLHLEQLWRQVKKSLRRIQAVILELFAAGYTGPEIARLTGYTDRRVYQLRKEAQAKMAELGVFGQEAMA